VAADDVDQPGDVLLRGISSSLNAGLEGIDQFAADFGELTCFLHEAGKRTRRKVNDSLIDGGLPTEGVLFFSMGKEFEVETPEICIGLTPFIGSPILFLREILREDRGFFRSFGWEDMMPLDKDFAHQIRRARACSTKFCLRAFPSSSESWQCRR